jgi:hypothetical protein
LAFGYDITDKFSIGGVLAGAWQYLAEDLSGAINPDGWVGSVRLTAAF